MTGLRQRIAAARSLQEIEKLLEEGKTYNMASRRVRHRWETTANRRRADLQKPKEEGKRPKKKEKDQ